MTAESWEFVLVDALEKVHPTRPPRPLHPRTRLRGFLGETISFQIAYRPPLISDFRDASSLTLRVEGEASDLVTAHAVELVPCVLPAFAAHDDGYERDDPGLYPDLLRPLDEAAVPVGIARWSSLWFDVVTTQPQRAGDHLLEIVLSDRAGRVVHRQSVQVEIVPGLLPPSDVVNTHWFHADALADYYGVDVFSEDHWRIIENFLQAAADMGANSVLTPVWTPPVDTAPGTYRTSVQLVEISLDRSGAHAFDFSRLRRWLEAARRAGIPRVEVPHLFTQWGAEFTPAIVVRHGGRLHRQFGWDVPATDPAYRDLLAALLPALCDVLDQEVGRENVVFHISDEPSGVDGLQSYSRARDVIADLLEGWTVVDALSDRAFYDSGAVRVPVVAVDHVSDFLPSRPHNLWVYYCVAQVDRVANRFLALPSARNRVLGHQMYVFEIDGFLHWGFNFYYSQYAERLIDPFRDTCAGGAFIGGDSFAVYPGPDGQALPSLRSKVHAQMVWDLRAFAEAARLYGRDAVLRVLDPEGTLRFDTFSYDPQHYLDVRAAIDDLIIGATQGT